MSSYVHVQVLYKKMYGNTQTYTHTDITTRGLRWSRGCHGNGGKEPQLFVLSILSLWLKQKSTENQGEVMCPDNSLTLSPSLCLSPSLSSLCHTCTHTPTPTHRHTHACFSHAFRQYYITFSFFCCSPAVLNPCDFTTGNFHLNGARDIARECFIRASLFNLLRLDVLFIFLNTQNSR